MGRGISDFEAYDYNPFRIDPFFVRKIGLVDKGKSDVSRADMADGRIAVHYSSKMSMMGYADGQDYIRLFAASWKKIFALSGTAQRILGFVFDEVVGGVDEVQLNAAVLRRVLEFKTAASVYVGIVELLEKKFVARKRGGDTFYINPVMFFGGNGRVGWHMKMVEFDEVHKGAATIEPEVYRERVVKNKKRDLPGLASIGAEVREEKEIVAGDVLRVDGEEVRAWKFGDGGWWCLPADYYDMECPDSMKRGFAVFAEGK